MRSYRVILRDRRPVVRLSSLPGIICMLFLAQAIAAEPLDLDGLWDFQHPAQSESRFREVAESASPVQKRILQTQIARTFGLRGEFAQAREILGPLEPALASATPEVQVRYHLELGRTYVSATHPKAALTPENRATARTHFLRAFHLASEANLDNLAIDALHMMAYVEIEPAAQLDWNQRALAYMDRSDQAEAKRWEGPLRNNLGYAKHLAADYEAAIREFRLSRAAYERAGRPADVRIADWMIAWTLRAQNKYEDALAIQLRLERECEAAGEPDPYVYEELELLYRQLGDESKADRYAQKLGAARK